MHRVPHTVTRAVLGISISWFYKWTGRRPTEQQRRRATQPRGSPRESHFSFYECIVGA
jgi:hypothetical protein